jgi:RNA polymerase subunit RPABC4/transcription elongation factor Spt4
LLREGDSVRVLYCGDCQIAFEGDQCPVCGRKKVREPLSNDACFLCEKQMMWAEMLAEALKNNGIPVVLKKRMGMGMALKVGLMMEHCKVYVPFSCLQKSEEIVDELFSETIESDVM